MRTTGLFDVTCADTSQGASCVFAPPASERDMTRAQYRDWLRSRLSDLAARGDLVAYRRWAGLADVKKTVFKGPYAEMAREFLMSPDFSRDVEQLDQGAIRAAERAAKRRINEIRAEKAMQEHSVSTMDLDFDF